MSDVAKKWMERAKMFAVILAVISPLLNAGAFFWLQERFPTRKEFELNKKADLDLYEEMKRAVAQRLTKQEHLEYVKNHDDLRKEIVDSMRRESITAMENNNREIARMNDRLKRIEDLLINGRVR